MAPWDASEDRALLLSVISVAQVNPNWEDVAAQLGKTKEAVRYDHLHQDYRLPTHTYHSQRFAKLKKEAGDPSAATNTGAAAAPAATPTPRKRKPKAKAKKTESDDEDEDEGTPLTKKSKQSKKVVKNEDEDEDEA